MPKLPAPDARFDWAAAEAVANEILARIAFADEALRVARQAYPRICTMAIDELEKAREAMYTVIGRALEIGRRRD